MDQIGCERVHRSSTTTRLPELECLDVADLAGRDTAYALVEIRNVLGTEVRTTSIHFQHISQEEISARVEIGTGQFDVTQTRSLERTIDGNRQRLDRCIETLLIDVLA